VLCASCGLDEPQPVSHLDQAFFRCDVQPLLVKSCAALACHGSGVRYLRLFGRNRMRWQGGESDRNAPLRQEELQANFDAASAMVDPSDPDQSFLLRKPLDVRKGGWFHGGAEMFGQGNVFVSTADPDFVTLRSWVHGATEDPSCIEPGSTL
jgi:hypothetical protein